MPTESFFSSASLAYLASAGAGKDGKTYSIKPTDGSGDFTFSRGSNLAATRVGPTGLIEKGRENLFLQSNGFSTSPWTSHLIDTPTSGQSGYDGSNNAWLIQCNNTSNFAGASQSVSSSGVNVFSFYAKAGNVDFVGAHINIGSQGNVNFELTGSGSVGSVWNSGLFGEIERVGTSDWYRCSFVFNGSLSNVRIGPRSGIGVFNAQIGDNIYIQDAQLEIGLAATEVIESGATTGKAGLLEDEPRFDYSGGATCPSLLLEPSRTNLIGYSELINPTIATSIWKQLGTNTFTSNYGTAPDGTETSTRVQFGTANSSSQLYAVFNTSAADYTGSIYLKGSGVLKFGFYDNTSVLTDTITLTSDWKRFDVTKTLAATSGARFWIYPEGVGASQDFEIWGAQCEQGSYPTSYIPTYGTTQTRLEDVCNDAGDASTFNSSEGVLYFEGERLSLLGDKRTISISDGSVNNYLYIQFQGVSNTIRIFYKTIEFGQVLLLNHNLSNELGLNKYAFRWSNNNFSLWINGTKELEQLNGSTATSSVFSELNFALGNGFDDFYGNVKQVLTFNTALTDTECIALTTL